jgi:predicted dehydrogenase
MPLSHFGVLLVSFSKHSHQRSFVPLYQRHPRTRIVAVADETDIDPELESLNRQWARQLAVPYISGIDRALALAEVDIVSMGHEIERRAELILRAAAAGKHLWIDKFMGANLAECDAVVSGIESAGVRAVIPSFTYGELARQSRTLIDSGSLGEIMGVHVDVMFSKGWPRPIGDDIRNPNFLPSGRWKFPDLKRELLTIGSYAIGLVQVCLKPIRHVWGRAGSFFFPEHAHCGAEDFGTLTLTDQRGCLATLCGGRIGVATHPYGGPSRAHLIGTEGTAVVDAKRPALDLFLRPTIVAADYQPAPEDPMQWASGPPPLGTSLAPDPVGLWTGLEDLIAAIDENRSPAYSVRQARDLMEILQAGYESALRGEGVTLPLEKEK